MNGSVSLALVHFPVLDRRDAVVGASVTNLDLHDISRSARTYGARSFYVVTPFADQQQLVREIVDHWTTGHGGNNNPDRCEAFSLVRLVDTVAAAIEDSTRLFGERPLVVATSARRQENAIGVGALAREQRKNRPLLLLLGTSWGLAPEIVRHSDHTLEPLMEGSPYNHLSVRAAAAIILDRLWGLCRNGRKE